MRKNQKVKNSVTFKVTDDELNFINQSENRSMYLRSLIQKDMYPMALNNEIARMVEIAIASKAVQVEREAVKEVVAKESIKTIEKQPVVAEEVKVVEKESSKEVDVFSAIGDTFL